MASSPARVVLQQQLFPVAVRVFSSALELLGPELRDAESVNGLTLAVKDCVQSALASVLREYNARLSPWRQLPDELWCIIWSELPMNDRIRVSYVCCAWRELAVTTPGLWCSLAVVSEQIRKGRNRSNMQLVAHLLKRSLHLPLHLRVLMRSRDPGIIGSLTSLLEPHRLRLEALHFDTDGHKNNVPRDFLLKLNDFPSLRALTCVSPRPPELHDAFRFALPSISAPVLRRLKIYRAIPFVGEHEVDVTFAAVTSFGTTIASSADLNVSLLRCFPRLRHLSICFIRQLSFHPDPPIPPNLAEELARIPSIHMSPIDGGNERLAMDLLRAPRKSALTIEYSGIYDLIPRAYELCADVQSPARLMCHSVEPQDTFEMAVVTVVTEDGLRREIRDCPTFRLSAIWKHLQPVWLKSLSIGANQWCSLLRNCTLSFSSVQSIEIALPPDFSFARLSHLGEDYPPAPRFDALESLRLVDFKGRGASLKAEDLVAFVRFLRNGARLKELSLLRVSVEGEFAMLLEVVDVIKLK